MILVIDNYDSFVYNLARYVELSGHKTVVHRNDAITIDDIEKLKPLAIIISPGPCTPKEAGISIKTIKKLGDKIPILGVCLGHQAIGEAYCGTTIRSNKPTHGKATEIKHNGEGIFKKIPSPIKVGRYHSLITELNDKNKNLIIDAQTDDGEIMAMHHKTNPVYGVQFHPESILTTSGLDIIKNFLHSAETFKKEQENLELTS